MREFFDLEGPWKVEKGPGGHERRETMTIWCGLQRSLSCGNMCFSECLLGVGREALCSAGAEVLCAPVLVGGGWGGEMLGGSVLGKSMPCDIV